MSDRSKDAPDLPAPSPEFEQAFTHGGSIVVECACGRTHFCDSERAGDFENGELESLREKMHKNPDRVLGWDCDSICRIEIDGKTFAEGCPCHGVSRYEIWIWNLRTEIIEYIFARLKRILENAKDEADRLSVAGKLMGLNEQVQGIEDAIARLDEAAVPKSSSPKFLTRAAEALNTGDMLQ